MEVQIKCHSELSKTERRISDIRANRFFEILHFAHNDICKNILLKRLSILIIISFFILYPSSLIIAQHVRLFACALASNDPTASMGGSSMGAGLWQSDDTAKTWVQLGWKHVKCYSVDVVNKSNGKIIYQACGNGVLRSTDFGATWRMLTDWRITEVMDICIDQIAPKNIYIATPEAIWKSNDGGDNWYEADSDIPHPIFVSRIVVDPKNHLKIYAAVDTTIYISNDGGLVWMNSKANAEEAHKFVIDEIKLIAGVDSVGILVWKDPTVILSVDARYSKNPYYDIYPLYQIVQLQIESEKSSHPDEASKNIHSALKLGKAILLASLDGGIWKYEYRVERSGLDSLQVWRLKAVDIK